MPHDQDACPTEDFESGAHWLSCTREADATSEPRRTSRQTWSECPIRPVRCGKADLEASPAYRLAPHSLEVPESPATFPSCRMQTAVGLPQTPASHRLPYEKCLECSVLAVQPKLAYCKLGEKPKV